jgi:pimeloyl-ACP methyl ester carboxylesterase
MPTERINGIDIHYEVSGEGPALVFLHGLMGSIARARAMGEGMDGLADRGFRLITYDARGHGDSGHTEDECHYTWEAHAADMLALLDHLGIERAALGGGSMGAGVSVTFALAHPERVERLLLAAPPPLEETIDTARQVFGGLASLIDAVGLEQAVAVAMQLPQFAEMKEASPQEYEQTRDWLLGVHPKATPLAIRGLLNGPQLPAERFGEITAPVLVIAHEGDPIHPLSTAQRLHEAIAGSRLVVAPDMTYFRERRGELLETVVAFLRGKGIAE